MEWEIPRVKIEWEKERERESDEGEEEEEEEEEEVRGLWKELFQWNATKRTICY